MSADSASASTLTVAGAIAQHLVNQGTERVFSLPGGHMKPIWDELRRRGVRIVTARHEAAAVHMAQAEADLSGCLAVAIVTTGPGLTNAVTGLGCAHLARSPVLVLSTRPPTEQGGMGALEEIDQAGIVGPLCRQVHVVRSPRHVSDRLDQAISAALGDEGTAGPAYVEFPTELLRAEAPPTYSSYPMRHRSVREPDQESIAAAAAAIADASRPLVITGRDGIADPDALHSFVGQIGAVYLETRSSRGAISSSIETYAPAARSRAISQADLVITVGRELDFEVGYGSPAVYRRAERFVRIGRSGAEVQRNRRADVELRSDPGLAMRALVDVGAAPRCPDTTWRESVVFDHQCRVQRLQRRIQDLNDDGPGMHPYVLLQAVNRIIDDGTIVIADGGDILSWSRSVLSAPTYLDLGPFGCLGVGVPFAVSAAITFPERRIIAVVGDGALGFNVMELETAVRENANVTVVVANNSAWNIERADQIVNYDGHVVGTTLSDCSFDQVADGLGVRGYHVDDTAELDTTLAEAVANSPSLVNVRVSGAPHSPDTLGGLATVPNLHALVAWDESEDLWLHQCHREEGRTMTSITAHQPSHRESPRGYVEGASAKGTTVAVSGQLPAENVLEANSTFGDQFLSALARFAEVIESAGANITDVLLLRIYVTDVAAYREAAGEFGRDYRKLLGGQFPATTLVEVSGLIDDRATVEIEGIAIIP